MSERGSAMDSHEVSFNEMLTTPSYFDYFRQFVCSEYSEQNILFYLACNAFKQKAPELTKPELLSAAQKLCSMYIGDDALLQVNLSKDEVKQVVDDVENRDVTENTFEKTKKSIMRLMERDSWTRFEKTTTYKRLYLLRETPTVLKPKTAKQEAAVRQSSILVKSFQIATTVALDHGSGFAEDFYKKLFVISPESRALLGSRMLHQARAFRGALGQLLIFMQPSEAEKFIAKVTDLARVHLSMGITYSMFQSFGKALIETLQVYLLLEEGTPEWDIIQRHWTAAFELISQEIMKGMRSIAVEKGLFKKSVETPPWLLTQIDAYHQYTSLTLLQIGRLDKAAFQAAFFENFFSLSPLSRAKFHSQNSQHAALFGAIEAVVKLLKKPNKMARVLDRIGKAHKDMGITSQEYTMFVRALRRTLRKSLGIDYTEKTDTVWKQFLELLVMFSVDGIELVTSGNSSASWKDLSDMADDQKCLDSDRGSYFVIERPSRDFSWSDSDSSNKLLDEPEIVLDEAYFQRYLPYMSPEQINKEVEQLNALLIYCTSQLRLFRMQEVQEFCSPVIAALLAPYTKDAPLKLPLPISREYTPSKSPSSRTRHLA